MTNTTNKTRNTEILNTIESDLWRAVDAANDAEDSRFNDKWGREDMMIGKWFNRMVECGKFDKDSANSQAVKDALAEIWSDVLPGIIKRQAKVVYEVLDDAGCLYDHQEALEDFVETDNVNNMFDVDFNEDGDGVEITESKYFYGIFQDFIVEFQTFVRLATAEEIAQRYKCQA